MKALIALWVIVFIALHQDIWNWTNKALVFGFVPVGLAYHAMYSIGAALTMALMVRYLWPAELDDENPQGGGAAGAPVPARPRPVVAGPGEANRR